MFKSNIFKQLIFPGALLLAIDVIFINFSKKMFEDQIISVQKVNMNVKPFGALIAYIFLILGLYYFIIKEKRSPLDAFIFGIVLYGVYEGTNYAILKNWKIQTVLVDTLWGGILMALTTYITYNVLGK